MSTHNKPPPPSRIEYNNQFVLRPVDPTDVPQIEKALHSSRKDLRVYMSWAHNLLTRAQLLDRVLTQWWNYFRGDEYEMALFDKASGEFLHYCGFYPVARINPKSFEIGYWTATAHQGKGLATLATQIQIVFLFEYLKADRIEITCNLENKASLRIIEKCGFQHEGTLRNFYPQGTEEMHAAGYTPEKRVALFSLIPEDKPNLSWYTSIQEKLTLYPLLDAPFTLKQS